MFQRSPAPFVPPFPPDGASSPESSPILQPDRNSAYFNPDPEISTVGYDSRSPSPFIPPIPSKVTPEGSPHVRYISSQAISPDLISNNNSGPSVVQGLGLSHTSVNTSQDTSLRSTSPLSASQRRRLLTLAFDDREAVWELPISFSEVERIARDWLKPSESTSFQLRIPADYNGVQTARFAYEPYLWLVDEQTYQTVIRYVDSIRIEIVISTSLPDESTSEKRRRRKPPSGKGRPGRKAKMTNPDNKIDAPRATDTSGAPEQDDAQPEIEDIANDITLTDDHPTNVTGHFCDLFVGAHRTYGKVALKRPRIGQQEYTREDVRRFRRESDTWRGLDHEFILRFIGTCRIGGYLYMVSPFIENGTLSDYLSAHPQVDRARLLFETAEALAYLHRCGIIHGDIKATNILVSVTLHALICDFGLTTLATSSTSTALKSAGSTRWQSPELWNNHPKTYQSDTYAFGMTITEVLTGNIPFAHLEQVSAVIMAVVMHDERPATKPMFSYSQVSYYPQWRAAIHCWLKDPQRRPSMETVAQMLKPKVKSKPQPAPPANRTQDVQTRQPSAVPPTPLPSADLIPAPSRVHVEEDEDEDEGSESEEKYCYCDGPSFGDMVPCENEECGIEWFHLACLNMASTPKEWYCLQCESAALVSGRRVLELPDLLPNVYG